MMVRARFLPVLGVLGMGILGFSQAHAADDPTGYWATEKNESQIHITHCGEKICGSVFWMKEPSDAKGNLKLDKENQDEAKRKRPLLGLQLISMEPDDENWKGTVYNPTNGKTYDATLKSVGKNQVELKGCVAYILCGGQKWTREEPKTVNTADSGVSKGPVHAGSAPAVHKTGATVPATGTTPPDE